MNTPKIYGALAPWYTLLTAPEDYEEEAAWYTDQLRTQARRPVREVLELGCGSGANAFHMKAHFQMVVSDLSEEMLAECAQINPELEQHQGDLRSFRLDRLFDAVFVHDAASYLLSEDDLNAAAATAAAHLRPGGVALFCPDDLAENFEPDEDCGGHDGPDGRGLRYLEWSQPGEGATVQVDYAFLIREADGKMRVVHDRHHTGRLPTQAWFDALESAGLVPSKVALVHSEVEADRHHIIVGVRPEDG